MVPPRSKGTRGGTFKVLLGLRNSPVLYLLLAALVWAYLSHVSKVLAPALVLLSARKALTWWAKLEVEVNGVLFKAEAFRPPQAVAPPQYQPRRPSRPTLPPLPAGQEEKPSPSSEFQSPVHGQGPAAAPGLTLPDGIGPEWAPFGPSLPYGAFDDRTCWLDCDSTLFEIRNIRYKTTREKVRSDFALYDCVGMDLIKDEKKIERLMERLPEGLTPALPPSPAGAPAWQASWGVPRVLCVNCQMPYKAGYMFGAHPEDDGGFSVVNYFVLSARSCELLARGHETPALQLWKRLVEEGVSSKEGISFKGVGRIEDLEKYEIPKSFWGFNNKPALITGSSKFQMARLPEVLEIDYDVRQWVYFARTTLCYKHQNAIGVEFNIGYLVEGKSDDELPEQILGCMTIRSMDITTAKSVSIMD